MEKPYVICHMLQSIDGKIAGTLFDFQTTSALASFYQKISQDFNGDAIIYGSVTLVERYGSSDDLDYSTFNEVILEDYICQSNRDKYVVAIDPLGKIGWNQSALNDSRLKNKQIIVVLSKLVNKQYLSYLKSLKISYIIAGDNQCLDLTSALMKLKKQFKINKALLQGGGIINASFLNLDLIDELSIVITPIACGDDSASLFSDGKYLGKGVNGKEYNLVSAKMLSNSGVHLIYRK